MNEPLLLNAHSSRRLILYGIVALCLLLVPTGSAHAAGWERWSDQTATRLQKGQTPALLLISAGYCRSCNALGDARIQSDLFHMVLLNQDENPRLASAYLAFAEAFTGQPVELPVVVAVTPYLDPVEAIGAVTPAALESFVTGLESRWSRDLFLESALLVRRLALQEWGPSTPDTPGSRIRKIYRRMLESEVHDKDVASLRALSHTTLYDQLGGGFHRAARDAEWHVPEFEKLLPDQAYAVLAYTAAWELSGDERMREVAAATADLLLREFRDPQSGLFYQALGSHSLVPLGGPVLHDGAYYVWDEEEIEHLLSEDQARVFMDHYGVTAEPDVPPELDRTGHLENKHLLSVAAESAGRSAEILEASRKLFDVRSNRPPPELDRSVVTWSNALAISALASAGTALDERRYVDAADKAARALLTKHYDHDGRRLYSAMSGRRSATAGARDYALLIDAVIAVYQSTFDPRLFAQAVELQRAQEKLFSRESDDGYLPGRNIPEMLVEIVPEDETAAISARNLMHLGVTLGNPEWLERAEKLGRPDASSQQLVILAGDRGSDVGSFLDVTREGFRPNLMTVEVRSKAERDALRGLIPALERVQECAPGHFGELVLHEERERCVAVALVCGAADCSAPTVDPQILRARIDSP
ncbi:MAG: AGE family epimerase/isomerase [Acidobacteria bacterium]|nr:AGE family epimerase/isomerase [Acidobacteriota bacterium]